MIETSKTSLDVRRISVGANILAVKVMGAGPTVILEMGGAFGGIGPLWGGVDDELAKFCRVVVYDRAGLGHSDPINGLPSMAERAQDLAALLDALGIRERAVFVGWSLGGMIVENFAARYPDRVGGLLLIDPSQLDLLGKAGRAARASFSVGMRVMNRIQLRLARSGFFRTRYGRNLMRKVAGAQFGARMTPHYAELVIEAATHPPMHKAMILEASELLDLCRETDRLLAERGLPRVPSILLSATHRPGSLEKSGAAFHKRILELAPGMELRELPETGHLVAGEAPESIVQAVRDLLTRMGS
jgi:pimeloyl-ACP methyl ester carboxylesterase